MVAAAADGITFVSHERVLSPASPAQRVSIWIDRAKEASSLLFRSTAPDGLATEFEILKLSAQVMKSGAHFPAPWLNHALSIQLPDLNRALEWAQTVWDSPFGERPTAASREGAIEIVDADLLPSLLGPSGKPTLPVGAGTKPLSSWKMEIDDAPILRALWRAIRPSRHLEFGTWEGFGVTLVASTTDAEIWTLNLAEGETDRDGSTLYAATDSGSFIGRLYRQAGYESRVHQILCDSRTFDTSPFESHPFDTVLIDGGHTPDVVVSDSLKALRILRPGGTCVWHDFCPDPETLRDNMAPLGVVMAIAENFSLLSEAFERFFWVRKSWILVGHGRK